MMPFYNMRVKQCSIILERAVGIEPTSSAWKAEVIAIIRCPHYIIPAVVVLNIHSRYFFAKPFINLA